MTENKKKIIWVALTIVALGLATYSALHSHEKTFETCLLCYKEGWFGFVGGFCFCYTVYLYQAN